MKQKLDNKELFILSPFEMPDVRLALETVKAGAFPVLHLGRNKEIAEKSLAELSLKTQHPFGVCIVSDELANIRLPEQVTKVIIPFGTKISVESHVEILHQVYSIEEAQRAIKEKVSSIVIKGNEGAGKVAQDSSFILFQGIIDASVKAGINLYIQGGPGIHTSAAFLAMGAQGIIMDSQIVIFSECSAPKEIKELCSKLSGNEMILIDDFKVLYRKGSPKLPDNPKFNDLLPFLGGYDWLSNYIPMGQDVTLSVDLYAQYKKLKSLVYAFYEALYGHVRQAKRLNIIGEDNPLARELGIKYPIAQGPMARISDSPEFVKEVADAGALPFLAMSISMGQTARDMLAKTTELLKDKTWGVGMLGFNVPEMRREQVQLVVEAKPKIVLVSGGRPSFAKPFEDAGIKVFLHVPSNVLLDQFIKEGTSNFIFEGRESGGHIGPFWSIVIWEKQMTRLFQEEDLSKFSVFFAGGIHDAFSSAFVSVMSAGLAARGVKIGVLMGTSYLYTKEIVKTGAINSHYQKLAVENEKTACLETVPGQISRVIPTPFVDYFTEKKREIIANGSTSAEIQNQLENMNIGRLRIAAKGIERRGDELVKLTVKEQYETGMYMIGDISMLTRKVTTLEKLHTEVAVNNNKILSKLNEIPLPDFLSNPVNIAVIGMDCILPEAADIDEYWKNIVTGKDCIVEVPDIRWNKKVFYKPDTLDSNYLSCKTGGFAPKVDFDPMEFGMTPQSLASIEPLQLLSLLVAKRALEHAGYNELTIDESESTSVIFAGEGLTDLATRVGFRSSYRQIVGEIPEVLDKRLPILNTDSFAGVLSNVTPGRISNRLNMKGRNYTVNSACASSLTALNIACKELTTYDSDMVVLGGDDFHSMVNDYLMFSSTHALSPKGYCASFDDKADGMTMGEGVGVVILKRLEDAEYAGDKIYAVIKGVGGSSDGKGMGLTAPNKDGQMLAMQKAYRSAGISPTQVGMIEAHGTGTVVGDRTEVRSTSAIFLDAGAVAGQTTLGTIKSQIGHTKCAAGMAGLLRSVLSVYYGVLPPTIHLDKPLDIYDKKTSPFVFNTQAGMWNDEKRIAGISSFGFGGANGHVVIESYRPEVPYASVLKMWPSELFVFRGDTLEEAKQQVDGVKKLLAVNNDIPLKNIAYSLAVENKKKVQIIIVASSIEELSYRIYTSTFDEKSVGIYYREEKEGKVAFLFSGQGSQRVNMARDLFVAFPAMRRLLLQNREYEKILFPPTAFDETDKKCLDKTITDTRNAQPLLGIVDYAIAEYLRYLGIEPDMVAGHSYGELPALCFAGAFDAEKLVSLSRERAYAILNAVQEDTGKMIAVSLPEEELNALLKDETEVWAVNFNSPKQTILAGSTPGIIAFIEKLGKQGIACKELNVACAFHSPLLNKAKELYADVLKDIPFNQPQIPVWSNTTAELYPENEVHIKERLAEHLIKPVLFNKEIDQMYADGARIFVEAGPGNVLTGLAQSIRGKEIVTIQTEAKGKEGIPFLLNALAQYLTTGKDFCIEKLFEDRDVALIDINQPEKYKKKRTVWRINGQFAVPIEGKLPSVGGMPFEEPLGLKLVSESAASGAGNFVPTVTDHSDKVMLEYLDSVRMLIQNQRDVMLGYFGQNPQEITPRRSIGYTAPSIVEPEIIQPSVVQQPVTSGTDVNMTSEQIKTILLEVVSDKTGYPIDMLGMDLDLEGDLSIDSIKRMEIVGELKDKLNLSGELEASEETFVKMASLKTLNELIAWIDELNTSSAASQPVQPATVEPAEPVAASKQTFDMEEIKTILLEVVSDKTGYPIDMLGMDLDLEGDLSIDSIKRMEIVGELRDKLNFGGELETSEEVFVKMASLRTLNELITWLDEMKKPHAAETPATPVQETVEEPAPQKQVELSRLLFGMHPYPLTPEKISLEGKRFALTDDGGENETIATAIKALLEKEGAQADIIRPENADMSLYDGVVLINSSTAPNYYTLHDLFGMIHGNLGKLKWVFTFSDIIAKADKEPTTENVKKIQGFSGLLKTLRLEYPEINFRSVVFNTLFDSQVLPQIVLDELTAGELFPEVFYKETERFRQDIRMENLAVADNTEETNLPLDKESVVLALGGAQGISPELVSQLSSEYPCHYILVGRSERMDDPDGAYAGLKSKVDIRKHLLTAEGMRVPAEIEKKIQKIFKSNQIAESIAKIEQSGAKVTYKAVDITDKDNFKAFLQSVRKEYGKIDAIIHAAGLLHDKFFADKTWESFEKVYQTKINPLHVILDEMNDDVKLIVLFSSVASSYGSKGQSDYAAGNSVLDFTASLSGLKSGRRILAFNWGPWKGAGMVSDSLEAEFARRGISLIPLKEGGAYFVNELKYGKEDKIAVMGGKEEVLSFLESLN
jgi:acyl transferase domain-containing protein/NAD(P)H-dependent flavin oxidoreductase YrpB (nitropropane dioxygenase family)/NAD(P)-dependent dehydrogenase (short-subunit alcohol dehydrogenase family)/acyl carrier protein